jgi:hypothetical protein
MDELQRQQPRGIPGVSYLRVMTEGNARNAMNVEVDKNTVTILSDTESRARFEGNQFVLPNGLTDEEVCEHVIGMQAGAGAGADLNPVQAFVSDAATTLIVLSGSKQTRKWQFLKKTFLPFVANEIFSQIGDKEQTEIDYAFHASVSAFEIQDEVVTDLLRPSTRGLTVSASAEEGVIIPGLLKETAKDEMQMRQLFLDACENRACHALPVGASVNTSCGLWEVHLAQSEGMNDGQSTRRCQSRLIILDLPCTDSLVNPDQTRPLESLTLHRSLVTFIDVIHRLNTPVKAALAPFRTSKLTHYLSELLGGNAIVCGLGCIVGNEAPMSRKTMDIVGAIGDSVHFPIGGRELTDVLSGLLGKYRAMILQLQDEIQNGAPIGEQAPDISEKVVTELQRDLASAQLDRNIAREDRQRIFEMMELLKAKYTTVMEEKFTQSQELVRAEEEKLSVARALVELKLEHSAKQEQIEKDKFEITSALLAAKNEIFDLDQQLLLSRTEGQSLKDASEDLEKRVQKDMEELVTVKSALQEVREQLQRETDTRIELGAELLTLLNQKSILQRKVDDQQQSLDRMSVSLSALNAEEKEINAAKIAAMDSLREKDDEIARQKRDAMKSDMEAKGLRMELEHVKQDAERAQTEWEREREAQLSLLRETESKLQETEKNLAAAGKNVISSSGVVTGGVDKSVVTRLEHKIRDLQREVKRAREDEDTLQNTNKHLEEELTKSRKIVQERLSQQIMNADEDDSQKDVAIETDSTLEELISFYKVKEEKHQMITDEALKNGKVLKLALQGLFDKYQGALDQVEDLINKKGGKNTSNLDETMFIGEAAMKAASDGVLEADKFESRIARERMELAESTIAEEQERMGIVLNAFKRRLKKTESKLAEAQGQSASLAAQVQQLVAAGPKKRPPSAEGRERDIQKKANADILKAMQDQFTKQIQLLKENAAAAVETQQQQLQQQQQQLLQPQSEAVLPVEPIPSRPSSRASTIQQSEVESIKQPTPPASAFHSLNASPTASRPTSASGMSLEQALKYIGELEQGASAAMASKLRDAEKRSAQLGKRCSQLEEEMRSYQAYMKETVMQYKRQLQTMAKGVPMKQITNPTDGKLPVI